MAVGPMARPRACIVMASDILSIWILSSAICFSVSRFSRRICDFDVPLSQRRQQFTP